MEAANTVTAPTFELTHRLARALEWSGVPKSTMAEHLGVSRQTIDNYIKGRTTIPRGYLYAWAEICRIPFVWLAFGDAVTEEVPGRQPDQLTLCIAA